MIIKGTVLVFLDVHILRRRTRTALIRFTSRDLTPASVSVSKLIDRELFDQPTAMRECTYLDLRTALH